MLYHRQQGGRLLLTPLTGIITQLLDNVLATLKLLVNVLQHRLFTLQWLKLFG